MNSTPMEPSQPGRQLPLILVIDDCEEPRRAIRVMLEYLVAARVMETDSSAEALDLATKHDFDLVTSDLTRPGMRGFEFISAFKQIRPNVPVIILSSVLNLKGFKARALELGAFACLEKPFASRQLREVVEDALRLPSPPVWRDPWA